VPPARRFVRHTACGRAIKAREKSAATLLGVLPRLAGQRLGVTGGSAVVCRVGGRVGEHIGSDLAYTSSPASLFSSVVGVVGRRGWGRGMG